MTCYNDTHERCMKIKPLILFTVFIDILGLGIIIPVLPFYVEHFGGSALAVTGLVSVYAFCSFLSGPVLGVLSDRFGRRPVLIGSIVSTALGWLVFASGSALPILFLGRIIDGAAAGNITTAQSLLSDIAKTDKERTTNLGLIGAMFGIGFILGPVIGGLLAAVTVSLPFWFAGGLATVNFLLALRFLPETHQPQRTPLTAATFNPLLPLWRGARTIGLRSFYAAWFFFTIAFSVQQSVLALYVFKVFGFGEVTVGLLMGMVGVLLAINQTVFLKYWITWFSERTLLISMFTLFGVGFMTMSIPVLTWLIVGMLVVVIGQSTLRSVITSAVSGFDPMRRGEHLGVMNSVRAIGLIIGPAIAGWLFLAHAAYPFYLAAGSAFIGLLIVTAAQRYTPKDMTVVSPAVSLPAE